METRHVFAPIIRYDLNLQPQGEENALKLLTVCGDDEFRHGESHALGKVPG